MALLLQLVSTFISSARGNDSRGYLKKWNFDIGVSVNAGDVLAEIDTPEVDQQLAQARAQLKVAQAALHLAEVTRRRNQDLFNRRVISPQDYDTATDTYRQNQASIDRLEALEAFKIVRAPFMGIVTARNTDIGDYIPAGSGNQLFRMQQTSPVGTNSRNIRYTGRTCAASSG